MMGKNLWVEIIGQDLSAQEVYARFLADKQRNPKLYPDLATWLMEHDYCAGLGWSVPAQQAAQQIMQIVGDVNG